MVLYNGEKRETVIDKRLCPACDSAAERVRGVKNGFQMLSCQRCETLYTPWVPDSLVEKYYDSYYTPKKLVIPSFVSGRLNEIISEFSPYRRTNRLLDVGCGSGSLLEAAARGGWTAEGLEVSQSAVDHARGLGFKVFCGEMAAANYPTGFFDVVTASEVFEHVPDPQSLIRDIARVLRPGGLLWATTPHGRGLSAQALGLKWSAVSPPKHLQLFSVPGIRKALVAAGFHTSRILTEGTNPFEILQALRNSRHTPSGVSDVKSGFVVSSYELNEALTKNRSRKALKSTVNWMLNVSHLGDSLKIWAER